LETGLVSRRLGQGTLLADLVGFVKERFSMPKIIYEPKKFSTEKLNVIRTANRIIADYQQQGFRLTVRQLYYRFVAGDLFPPSWKYSSVGGKWVRDAENGTNNAQPNYNNLGVILGDARMAGLVDWDAIEDRTREITTVPHWENPASIIEACERSFRLDKWNDQQFRVECWVEKDALEGIVSQAANAEDVAAFSCRGYSSLSSLWEASQRLGKYVNAGQRPIILHLGDHDPSGIDMTRDISERLNTFVERDWYNKNGKELGNQTTIGKIWESLEIHFRERHGEVDDDLIPGVQVGSISGYVRKPVTVIRIALNMNQIEEYNPPPNPAKATDSRYQKYKDLHGDESWELDALEPAVLTQLVVDNINKFRNTEKYSARQAEETEHRADLNKAARAWPRIADFLSE